MRNLWVLGLLLLFFVADCGRHTEEEEPNNTLSKAMPVDIPAKVSGRLNNGLDEDYYRFEVPEEDYYSFSISNLKGFDIMLQILDSQGNLIKKADDYFKNFGESLPNLFLKPGVYYVKISSGMNDHKIGRPVVVASENYSLKIDLLKNLLKTIPSQMEKEENDDFASSQEIKQTQDITGYFYPFINPGYKSPGLKKVLEKVKQQANKDFMDKDLDVYNFFLSTKGDYLLQMEISATEDFDPTIIIVDQRFLDYLDFLENQKEAVAPEFQGNLFLMDSKFFDKGEGIANYRIMGNNKYYVILGAMNRLNYQALDKMIGNSYKLSYKIMEITSDMESEPNDNFESAKKIQTNLLKGYLNPTLDKDFYVIEGDEESFYRLDSKENSLNTRIVRIFKMASVSVIPPADLDLALDIYGEDLQGKDIKFLKTIDNKGKGQPEEMPNLLMTLQKKMYFVVRGGSENDTDNYQKPYEFKFSFSDKENEDMEHEPNDEAAFRFNEGPNTFSDSIKAFVNNKGDVDNFYTFIPDRGNYRFSLKSLPGATFVLEIYDSNNYFMKRAVATKAGEDFSFEAFMPKRQVLNLKVYTLEKNFFNVEIPYTLSVAPAGSAGFQ